MSETRVITREDKNVCEWNPELMRPATEGDAWHADATMSIGREDNIHVCDDCAKLPVFKLRRYRVRLKGGKDV